ncbi:hypothetical protein IGB42_03408 [Andreprevotia sp. IGB-42]|uniref:DUF6916 family protein n=1 Tax=Andreprevotia sp. IGB-42 TaxID=2497473 RepID=UPI00135B1A39|nr:hypothetical protein [Andreprevotia sp. IGB-42]KAF0812131.1 hypothetical protein IGB42_03408 [Andreprevotia sp. IGB-42]
MTAIPSFTDLQQSLEQNWHLSWEGHGGVDVQLVEVNEGVAMNRRFECYSAVFRQPAGLQLPQYTYLLHSPAKMQWPVMLTPIGPDEDGEHHLLQAVFHCRRPVEAAIADTQ